MNGSVRNFLLLLAREGGARLTGANEVEELDPAIEHAVELGYVSIVSAGWGAGDRYVITREGWDALDIEPPSDWRPELHWRDLVAPYSVVLAATLAAAVLVVWLTQTGVASR